LFSNFIWPAFYYYNFSGNAGEEYSVIRVQNSRLIDSGGGFLIDEKDLEEEQSKEVFIWIRYNMHTNYLKFWTYFYLIVCDLWNPCSNNFTRPSSLWWMRATSPRLLTVQIFFMFCLRHLQVSIFCHDDSIQFNCMNVIFLILFSGIQMMINTL
jgi:hypothetical protein